MFANLSKQRNPPLRVISLPHATVTRVGAGKRKDVPKLHAGKHGFSLIELLVVLMIMGLLVTLVTVTARPDDRAVLRLESDRLAELFALAISESELAGKSLAWTSDGRSYRFWRKSGEAGWQETGNEEPLRGRPLPQDMQVADFRVDAAQPEGKPRIEFGPYAPPQAFILVLALGSERCTITMSPTGDLKVYSGGEATHEIAPTR